MLTTTISTGHAVYHVVILRESSRWVREKNKRNENQREKAFYDCKDERIISLLYFHLFFFFFLVHPWHVEVPGPGNERMPQNQTKPQQ